MISREGGVAHAYHSLVGTLKQLGEADEELWLVDDDGGVVVEIVVHVERHQRAEVATPVDL